MGPSHPLTGHHASHLPHLPSHLPLLPTKTVHRTLTVTPWWPECHSHDGLSTMTPNSGQLLATHASFYLKPLSSTTTEYPAAPRTQPQGDGNTGALGYLCSHPKSSSTGLPLHWPRRKHFQITEKKSNNEEHEEAGEVYRIMEESMVNNIHLQGKILNLNMVKHKPKRDVP